MRPFKTYAELKRYIGQTIGKYVVATESEAGIEHNIPPENLEILNKDIVAIIRAFIIGTCLESDSQQTINQLIEVVSDIPEMGGQGIDKEAREALLEYLKENKMKYIGLGIVPKKRKIILRGRSVCLVGSFTRHQDIITSELARRGAYVDEFPNADIIVYGNQTITARSQRFIERAHELQMTVISEDDLMEVFERNKKPRQVEIEDY